MNATAATGFDLNPAQRIAVDHPGGPLLVVAGAGSGKTRVLTARIVRLIERGATPEAILAFTFTNRAAREMRGRIEALLGPQAARLWVGTFHATAVRILRREAGTLGLPERFTIYDRDDQEAVLRDVLAAMGRGEARSEIGPALNRISDAKNALVSPEAMARAALVPDQQRVAEIYRRYQLALRANGALDFDDLIAESVRLFRDHSEAGARWAKRFEHVLVDEYQDTNHAQFQLVAALGAGHRNLFVVGDDDQSIYGWRGADLANILDFDRAFPGAEVVRLEQNYRSTKNILDAANAVIGHNRARRGKSLWSERGEGARLRFVLAADEIEEARRVRAFLQEIRRRGRAWSQCAVLYRTNAQSRAIEAELRQHLMPYEVIGGLAFFQRREVKDLVAYLRAALNPADRVSFFRVWNTPRRGLGPAVLERVEARMQAAHETAPDALRALIADGALGRAAGASAREFLGVLDAIRGSGERPVDEVLRTLIESVGFLDYLDGEDQADERRANVGELVASAEAAVALRGATLLEFVAEAALMTDADRSDPDDDRVRLLTVHNAKGLEFPVVVVAGLEEGLMPHGASIEDGAGLEEERRLFYVALTRAEDEVLLTAAAFRRRFDGARGAQVSRFLAEIPDALIDRDESGAARRPARTGFDRRGQRPRDEDDADRGFDDEAPHAWNAPVRPSTTRHRAVGRAVYHETFGRGVVVQAEGDGADARFTVRFGTQLKKVLGRFLDGGDDGDPA